MNFRLEAALANNPLPPSALDENDMLDQLSLSDRADWTLFGLVSCTAIATLLLAAVVSLLR